MKTTEKPIGLIVLMPTRGAVSIESLLCINEHLEGSRLLTSSVYSVVTARNLLAKWARESDEPYVLWLDDDTWFTREHVDTALGILEDNTGIDAVTAMASFRHAYSKSCTTRVDRTAIAPIALEPGELAPVFYTGFHFIMMRRTLLERLGPNPVDLIYDETRIWPEDSSFCLRVKKIGGKIVTEKSLVVGHVESEDGLVYFPFLPAMLANGAGRPLTVPKDQVRYRPMKIRHYGLPFEPGYRPERNAA
jgi:hypothetical protein